MWPAKVRESLCDVPDFLDIGLEYFLYKGEVTNGGDQLVNSRVGVPGNSA